MERVDRTAQRLDQELAEVRHLLLGRIEGPVIVDDERKLAGRRPGRARPGGPKRVLCSLGIGSHADLLRVSSVTFQAYAERHGYDLLLSTRHIAPDRPPSWSKIPLVRGLLDQYDEVLWIDADAIFVDISKDLGDLVKPGKDLYLVEHTSEGGRWRAVNLGVFLIRSTEWSRGLLDDVWAAERYIDHRWWENAALLDMLGYELPAEGIPGPRKVRCTELDQRVEFIGLEWNSGGGGAESFAPEPRIRHHGRRAGLRQILEADLVTCLVKSGWTSDLPRV